MSAPKLTPEEVLAGLKRAAELRGFTLIPTDPASVEDMVERGAKAAAQVWTSENKKADLIQTAILFEPTARAVLTAAIPGLMEGPKLK